jgi:hypothetical protein
MDQSIEKIEQQVEFALHEYPKIARRLYATFISIGIIFVLLAICFSIYILLKVSLSLKLLLLLGCFLVCWTFISFAAFIVGMKGNNYKNACKLLQGAYVLYKQKVIKIEELLTYKSEAEKMLNDVDFSHIPD